MTETNYVIINSKFRSSSSKSTSDFTFNLGESLEISDVAIKSVSLVNAEYNIKKQHNTLIVNNGAIDYVIVVPVGQYNINQLIAVIETELTTAYGGTNTITLDPITQKLIFSTTTAIRFRTDTFWSPLTFILGLGDTPDTPTTLNYYPTIPSSNINAPFFPNLQGANNYHIVSNTIGQGQGSLLKNNDKRPIILSVPVTETFGNVINYEVNEINLNKRHFSRPTNIQSIDIKIIDDDNEIVDLGGTNIEIVLQIIKVGVMPFSVQADRMKVH
jgi:hypothetical protein